MRRVGVRECGKRQQELKNAAVEAERARLLEVGDAMMRDQKEL